MLLYCSSSWVVLNMQTFLSRYEETIALHRWMCNYLCTSGFIKHVLWITIYCNFWNETFLFHFLNLLVLKAKKGKGHVSQNPSNLDIMPLICERPHSWSQSGHNFTQQSHWKWPAPAWSKCSSGWVNCLLFPTILIPLYTRAGALPPLTGSIFRFKACSIAKWQYCKILTMEECSQIRLKQTQIWKRKRDSGSTCFLTLKSKMEKMDNKPWIFILTF